MRELDWCLDAIARWSGTRPELKSVLRLASRTAILHRITVSIDGTERRFYAKRYADGDIAPADLERRFADLRAIAGAIGTRAGLRPFVAVAAAPEESLLLTLETAGRPLGTLQRSILWNAASQRAALDAWRGAGAWLDALHWSSVSPQMSDSHAAELAAYTLQRLTWWKQEDPAAAGVCAAAEQAVRTAGSALQGTPIRLVACHGDVTSFNILVDGGVGLIDFDDFRFDLPGGDVSQALLELDQFSTFGSFTRLHGFRARAVRSFFEGYTHPVPDGAVMWLPHLRNLAVRIVTLVRRRRGVSLSRATNAWHYRRAVEELTAATRAAAASVSTADYFRRA
jgi:hypothetical protein